MRILSYSGESVLTTDGMGQAVGDYARALIADNSTDVVDIPVLVHDEELTATIVIGPASQLFVVASRDREVALRDEMPIARLRAKIAALQPHRVLPTDSPSADDQGYDYL